MPALTDLEESMVFCMLDRLQPYDRVCLSFDALKRAGLVSRQALRLASVEAITSVLREAGYRFPNLTARNLHEFGANPIDLGSASRDELVDGIAGVGPKIASLFIRNTRNGSVAIVDVHIKAWLAERGYDVSRPYAELEKSFLAEAQKLGRHPGELDWEIWEARRSKRGSRGR